MSEHTGAGFEILAKTEGELAALFPAHYSELRRLAAYWIRRERPEHTLQATALVHEAFLRSVNQGPAPKDRSHFLALVTRLMRQALVDHARTRRAQKRGSGAAKVALDQIQNQQDADLEQSLCIDEALYALERESVRRARVVELKFFGGLTFTEIAEVLDISERTVQADWEVARVQLRQHFRVMP